MDNRTRRDLGMAYVADKSVFEEVLATRRLLHEFNQIDPDDLPRVQEMARRIFGKAGRNLMVMQPFFCDYGKHIEVGDNFFANFGCTILDVAKVEIGDNVFFAPNVSIYTAGHPLHPESRNSMYEYCVPVKIGSDCWLGGNVVVVPGVTIGDGCVIGAGSVVAQDIPPYSLAVGNPCRVIRKITEEDRKFYRTGKEFDPDAWAQVQEFVRRKKSGDPSLSEGRGLLF